MNTTFKTNNPGLFALGKLIRYGQPYQWHFVGAFALLLIATGIEMLAPWLMKIILDDYIAPGKSDVMELAMLGSTLLMVYIASSILQYVQNIIFQANALKVVHDIRSMLFAHVLTLPMSYFDSEPTGRLVSRITNDSEVLRQMFVGVIPSILQAFFRVTGIFIAMSFLDIRLMFMTLLLIPVMLFAIRIYQKISHPIIHEVRIQLANINTRLNESLIGMRIIQAMGQEPHLQKKFDKDNKKWSRQKHKNINADSLLLMPFTHLLNAVALAVVVGWFGYRSGFNAIEIGTLYAFINYLGRFFEPFRQITMQMSNLQQSIVAAERLFEVLDEPSEVSDHQQMPIAKEKQKNQQTSIQQGRLEFRDVSLSYDNKNRALNKVSFTVEPGQFIAIVGHSGSGKSSVINLLMRFYRHQQGQILVDGQPLQDLSENALRQGLGLVFQEPYIFSGTLAENISLNHDSLNHKDITPEQVRQAAEKVHANHFIERLEKGYQHVPGAGGQALSTGEHQLLSFARTIAQNPKILLLDEATANIDGETEHAIKEALITLREDRTTIAVAHRLSTIQDADQILVMNKGEIVQRGTHEQLLQQSGHYLDLYLAQQTEEQLSDKQHCTTGGSSAVLA